MGKEKELAYYELNQFCDEKQFDFDTTENLSGYEGVIGQEKAVKAFEFGLKVKMKGYNIYMTGSPGSGRTTYAKNSAQNIAKTEKTPYDYCYVYNFENQRMPLALKFEPGVGKQFLDDMNELIEILTMEIPKAFNSDDYEKQKNEIIKGYQDKRDELIKAMTTEAKEHNFGVKVTNSGIYFLPIVNGETISEDDYDDLSDEIKDDITKHSDVIQERAAEIMRSIKEIEKATRKEIESLEYKIGMFALGHHFNSIQEKYKGHERVKAYLNAVKEDILENIGDFIESENEEEDSLSSLIPWISKKGSEEIIYKYKVNLIIDNSMAQGAPVIMDFNPTYYNLIGEIEYDNEFGNLVTDFMKIKPGLLHKANGGYLILQVQDVLSNVQTWEALRRALKTKEISIESLREQLGGIAVATLKPEPIPMDIKIIMVGSSYYYEILNIYDEEFTKLFKIRADFDYEMKRSTDNIMKLARFIRSFTEKENTMPFSAGAIAKVVEHSQRLSERKDKLITCLSLIEEVLMEAVTWAQENNEASVSKESIIKAIYEKEQRVNMYEEKILEMIEDNTIMIDTTGCKCGQLNGLAVIDTGSHTFAAPTRITATTYLGKAGIINIEKEAEMSGAIHDKGVQVLNGYLGQTYAQEFPLSLSCRICFEQNYNGIDGDSASSTELYAILSSLSEIPINQEIAVTGSINQRGEIQPIGGVTYKIEGFFNLCKKRGLTGTQGVIIPHQNIPDLTLKDEVIEAVKEGLFHVYPISHINEGIEILMDVPAGAKDERGNFQVHTVHDLVYKKMREYYIKSLGEEMGRYRKRIR